MKQNIIGKTGAALASILILHSASCNLNTIVKDPNFIPASVKNAPEAASIEKAYQSIYFLTDPGNIYGVNEYSGDIAVAPTRGTDWYDGGVWVQHALHSWTPSHVQNRYAWESINKAIYQSTVVSETASGQKQAEGKFIRAFVSYLCCDLFGQVQHRPATADVSALPDVFTRSQAIDYVISELLEALPKLPPYNGTNRGIATQEAAKFLLAKAYLNKAVYKQDPKNPEGPFDFKADDMNKAIRYCDEIDANPSLDYSANYWDNFKWDNSTGSKENIFVCAASNSADVNSLIKYTLHYNMSPTSWNGVVILPAFYDSFEDGDVRKNYRIPGNSEYLGYNAGFIVGQAYAPQGPNAGGNKAGPGIPVVPVNDRGGNPLIFTKEFSLYASSEEKGIRYNKFPLSVENCNNQASKNENDFPVFRYADMRLMKAEAILRGGTSSETASAIVNELRSKRLASALAAVDLPAILAERGRELYLEGWRRPDLVRFGKYNDLYLPEQKIKPEGSRVILPIPDIALISNPNLRQNFGY